MYSEWKVSSSGISIVGEDEFPIAICYPDTRLKGPESLAGMKANAHLIAAAVNACIKLNPDNPMAVAESISELYEALRLLVSIVKTMPQPFAVAYEAEKAIAKAEVK